MDKNKKRITRIIGQTRSHANQNLNNYIYRVKNYLVNYYLKFK